MKKVTCCELTQKTKALIEQIIRTKYLSNQPKISKKDPQIMNIHKKGLTTLTCSIIKCFQ